MKIFNNKINKLIKICLDSAINFLDYDPDFEIESFEELEEGAKVVVKEIKEKEEMAAEAKEKAAV